MIRRSGFLAWRNLSQQRTRTILSALAVALGVTMIVAGNVIANAIFSAHQKSERGQNVEFFAELFDLGLTIVGVAILVAAGFLVFNAFAMAITQRRRQIGALRSLGMTRGQVMRLVLVEALITGGTGVLMGLIAGPLLGRGLIALLEAAGKALDTTFAVFGEPSVSLSSVIMAVALGVGITFFSTLLPARQATRVSPLEALRQDAGADAGIQKAGPLQWLGLIASTILFAYLIIAPPGKWTLPPWDIILPGLFIVLWLACLGLILPAVVGAAANLARGPLSRLWGATGRLIADNLKRNRQRVMLTVLSLAVGLTMIVSLTGVITFMFGSILGRMMIGAVQQDGWLFARANISGDMMEAFAEFDLERMYVPDKTIQAVREVVGDRAAVSEWYMVIVPELSFLPGWNSYIADVHDLQKLGAYGFALTGGEWEDIIPVMESGCGLLLTPLVARNNDVRIGDTISVTGPEGPVECTVAGIGSNGISGNASFISIAALDSFGIEHPSTLVVAPYVGADKDRLDADLRAEMENHPGVLMFRVSALFGGMEQSPTDVVPDNITTVMNSMLLLAILAATLGVVNTTMMNIHERRHELGLLRAVGAKRRQVTAVVIGEAALMGFVGAVVGLVAGAGVSIVFALTYGGNAWGFPDFPLWEATWEAVGPALLNGLFGLVFAPLISAAAAYLPTRSVLRGSAIDTMDPMRQPETIHRPRERRTTMRRLSFLALRNLDQQRARTILSVLAVALGVAMTLAASMIGQSILGAISGAEGLAYLRGIMEQLRGMLEMVSVGIGLVAGFMVFNAFLMSITQRRQQIGALRSLGMTRRQVMRLVLVEALVVAIIGTVAGMVVGPLLGAGAAAFARIVLAGMFALKLSSPTLTSMVLAVGVGIGITLVAVLVPARQAARISPLVALRGEVAAGTGSKTRSGLAFWIGSLVLGGLAAFVIGTLPGEWVKPPQDILLMMLCLALLVLGLALVLPALVGVVGRQARGILRRVMGASGRLAADNLGRERGRVLRTLAALAVALAMIAGLQGILHFVSYEIVLTTLERVAQSRAWIILPFDITKGLAAVSAMERVEVSPEAADEVRQVIGERGTVLDVHFVVVPELSFIGDTYFSILADPHTLQQSGSSIFAFTEGNWDTAMPIMERGCGVLALPVVAARHGIRLGDTLTVTGKSGPVQCTLAGIGSPMANATIVSQSAGEELGVGNPTGLILWARAGEDRKRVQTDVEAALAHYPSLYITDVQTLYEFNTAATDALPALFNVLLVAAIVAAALGVVNTTLMSVTERRHELGLLRAVGATRRQVTQVVVGEAALIGLVGGVVGVVAGLGITAIVVLVYGGSAWGAPDLDLWGAAWRSVRPALLTGLLGMVAAPVVSAAAAYLPVRSILRGPAIETMDVLRQLGQTQRPSEPGAIMRRLDFLAWRNLDQQRTRTILSVLAVALGVAMTIAADVVSSSLLNTIAGSEDAQAFMRGLLEYLGDMLTMIGVGITLAAGFLVFNAFAMSITQRRQQIGALRTLGMTRRQIMRLVLVEALLVGGLGVLVGTIAGPLMGRGTITLIKSMIGDDLFVFEVAGAVPSNLLLAAGLGIGITLVSVLIPALRATRVSPLVALREDISVDGAGTRRVVFLRWIGLVFAVVMVAYLAAAPPGEWIDPPWNGALTAAFALVWLGSLGLMLPTLIGGVGRWMKGLLVRLWGASGRLMADNVRRGRGRVAVTVATLAVALAMIVGLTGFIRFTYAELMLPKIEESRKLDGWMATRADVISGMASYADEADLSLSPDAVAEIRELVGRRGQVMEWYFAIVPELSFFGSSYFSFVLDPHEIRQAGDFAITFTEGDWDSAMPLLEGGCGVLLSPAVAARNGVSLGESFQVTGAKGPVECTVAGIGATYVNASIVSSTAARELGVADRPTTLLVWPLPGEDRASLEADLLALVERRPDVEMRPLSDMADLQSRMKDMLPQMFNALLLLAVVAAALGIVNTTMMSVAERRRELGLLRAVGATRRQVTAVVAGEAALIGVVGGALGMIAGVGITVITATVFGGRAWGIADLDLWGAAWRSMQPALLNGLLGMVVAPVISAAAAYLPVRSILRGTTIETMEPERVQTVPSRERVAGILGWGSIRVRFALGTGILMLFVLTGLIAVVTTHARVYLEEQIHDALRTMVVWNAGIIELGLPDDAETLDFDALTGQAFDFDSDAMLRFETLVDEMMENGLVDLTVADRDDVVLISLDRRQIGMIAPELETTDQADVYSERDGGEWLVHATAPIRNEAGDMVGSVRLVADAEHVQDFLARLRGTLWVIGGVIVAAGVAVGWRIGTPLVRATHELTAHAAEVGRGEYTLFRHPAPRGLAAKFSLRTRLTLALIVILVVMVGTLELVMIPTERRHVEDTLKDGVIAGAEWIGQILSDGLDNELLDVPFEDSFSLEQMLSMTQSLDLAELQALTDQMRSEDIAYTALVDNEGTIVLSDQLSLIGDSAPVPSDTRIEDASWRDEDIWVVSTPLRQGREGEQVGALCMGIRREAIEAFLDESRNLFQLSGLVAVLAGILLAQAIGRAVSTPVSRLAAGTHRIAEGDLDVRFDVRTGDELAMLASAYNQMTLGLQEREWLRDMFGRFVSQEVAEAIRTGQVRLAGESRVVSVLFCDIRDFTALSERRTPEEVVALLNEYLPVVVDAAQRHGGTVNRFGGDSTLVIYGAPRALQESAYNAVLTALEMRANLNRLNVRLADRGEESIRMGIGINTGVALAGAVGPEERQEYTVIGDTVNLASRIEALNKQYPDYDILISQGTYDALGSRRAEFHLTDLGEILIRGKVEAITVWAVVDWVS